MTGSRKGAGFSRRFYISYTCAAAFAIARRTGYML